MALDKGVRFCLSDDSHGCSQVAYGYQEAIQYIKKVGMQHIYYTRHIDGVSTVADERFPTLQIGRTAVGDLD